MLAQRNGKLKSQKLHRSTHDRAALWNIFDAEVANPDKKDIPLECVYGSGNREQCERCSSLLAFSEEGFLACTNNRCSIIYKDLTDQGAEWRYYGADDNQNADPTRCGMPINPLLEESSYGCRLIPNGPMSYEMRKISRYSSWLSIPYKEKSQYDEFLTIKTAAENAGISKIIIDDAIMYHKRISEYEQNFRGVNRDGIIAASIYISCRKHKFPRTPREIATMFHLEPASATRGCKNATLIINELEKDLDQTDRTDFGTTKPQNFIERYCSKLSINNELTKLCQFVCVNIDKNQLMPENTPPSIAAGVVYYVAQLFHLNISKRDITNVSETSEVTINKCCKKLEQIAKSKPMVPTVLLRKYGLLDDATSSMTDAA